MSTEHNFCLSSYFLPSLPHFIFLSFPLIKMSNWMVKLFASWTKPNIYCRGTQNGGRFSSAHREHLGPLYKPQILTPSLQQECQLINSLWQDSSSGKPLTTTDGWRRELGERKPPCPEKTRRIALRAGVSQLARFLAPTTPPLHSRPGCICRRGQSERKTPVTEHELLVNSVLYFWARRDDLYRLICLFIRPL